MASDITKRRSHAEAQRRYWENRRRRKFVQKFGQQNFLEHYLPLYKEHGTKHLPGVKILAVKKSLERKDNICAHRRK
ncbi:hypothetical protein B0H14DRAFT_3482317 [Mycena olivaceomarginata]|nr:hypothetical protein B0H14DRAFT_3482317 [Mycena olivaceomarginata]